VSKIWIHIESQPERGTEYTDLISAAPLSLGVKGVNVDKWPYNPFPGRRVIARFTFPNAGDGYEHSYMRRGWAGAGDYVRALQSRYQHVLAWGIDEFESPNEPIPEEADLRAYLDFMLRWVEIAPSFGFRPWVGQWPNGWPHDGWGAYMAELAQAAYEAGGGMGVHGYSAPGLLDAADCMTLRYRRTAQELWGAGLPKDKTRMILSEFGIDGMALANRDVRRDVAKLYGMTDLPTNKRGWRDWQDWRSYHAEYGIPAGGMTEARYLAQIKAFSAEIDKDDYLDGAALYGGLPFKGWGQFVIGGGMLREIVRWHEETPPEPEPEPEPTPEPELSLHDKAVSVRWRMEEAVRMIERADPDEARTLLLQAIPDAYEVERALKDHVTITSQWETRTIDDKGAVTTTSHDGVGTYWVPPETKQEWG
jgi:hypothetical protein